MSDAVIRDPLANEPLDWSLKGIPPALIGLRADAIRGVGVGLFDDHVLFPAAVLRREALDANRAWMRRFLERTGTVLAPHGKTSMAPALFERQRVDGAWGFTAATVQQVRAYRRFGVRRVLMANQLVGAGEIGWVLDELALDPAFEFYAFVDSVEAVAAVERAAAARGATRPIDLLVEAGGLGGRAGVRTVAQGLEVARAARAASGVRLAGVAGYEGVFQTAPDSAGRAAAVLDLALALAEAGEREGHFGPELILTAGGSGFFDLVAGALARPGLERATAVMRSGCYLTHDHGLYERLFQEARTRDPELLAGEAPRPALEVWARVLSRPEPGRIICGAGKRDLGADAGLPAVVGWARPGDRRVRPAPQNLVTAALYDQHATVDGPVDMPFAVGDLVGFGVSHPCTTFDKWRALLLVDAEGRIEEVVRTFF